MVVQVNLVFALEDQFGFVYSQGIADGGKELSHSMCREAEYVANAMSYLVERTLKHGKKIIDDGLYFPPLQSNGDAT